MIMLQILFLLQDPYKHLSSIVLILWTTRDQSFISISSLGVNKLFHVKWQLIPNIRIPTYINSTTSTWFNFKYWTKIQGMISEYNQFYSPVSPWSQNLRNSHNAACTLFKRKTHSTFNSKSPKTSNLSCHTTTPEIIDTFILSLVLVPKETRANTFKPFLEILSAVEIQSSWFFQSSSSNQVLFLSN